MPQLNVSSNNNILWPILVVISQAIISLSGLLAYFIFFIIIFRYRTKFLKHSFWILSLHLLFPDCLFLILVFIYELPCIFLQRQVYGADISEAFANLNTIFFFTIILMMVLMCADRYVKVVVQGNLSAIFDSHLFVHITASICWLLSISLVIISHLSGCRKFYMEKFYLYYIICYKTQFAIKVIHGVAWASIGILIFLYCLIFLYIKCKHKVNLLKKFINMFRFLQ